jgi:hypothetical protein
LRFATSQRIAFFWAFKRQSFNLLIKSHDLIISFLENVLGVHAHRGEYDMVGVADRSGILILAA